MIDFVVDELSRRSQVEPEPAINKPPLQLRHDECVRKLAALVKNKDDNTLSVVAKLIGRLAVPIE
jgi:hypothetical protein